MNQLIKSLTAFSVGTLVFTSAALAFPRSSGPAFDQENWKPPQPLEIVAPRFAQAHDGSTVHVKLTIDTAGNASAVTVLFPHDPQLERNIVKAVKQWKFEPAQRDGKAVESRVVLPLELKLDRNS